MAPVKPQPRYCNHTAAFYSEAMNNLTNKSLKSLKLIQNIATHVLTRASIRDHIFSSVMASLHWLTKPV